MPTKHKIDKWSKSGFTNNNGKKVFGTGSILHNLKRDREKPSLFKLFRKKK